MTQGQQAERRGQDSNLRTSFPVTDLANRRFRPLSHLSQNPQGPTAMDRTPDYRLNSTLQVGGCKEAGGQAPERRKCVYFWLKFSSSALD